MYMKYYKERIFNPVEISMEMKKRKLNKSNCLDWTNLRFLPTIYESSIMILKVWHQNLRLLFVHFMCSVSKRKFKFLLSDISAKSWNLGLMKQNVTLIIYSDEPSGILKTWEGTICINITKICNNSNIL